MILLLTGCSYDNSNSIENEDRSAAIESVEKEKDKVDRKNCIVGEIISVEEDYVYSREQRKFTTTFIQMMQLSTL